MLHRQVWYLTNSKPALTRKYPIIIKKLINFREHFENDVIETTLQLNEYYNCSCYEAASNFGLSLQNIFFIVKVKNVNVKEIVFIIFIF